jgi:hypothetical protein
MASSSSVREERRAALVVLQRLLLEAEDSIVAGRKQRAKAALEQLGLAFELFQSGPEKAAGARVPAPDQDARWTALAGLLKEVEESVSRGDPKGIEEALRKTREALDVCCGLDQSSHASGVRRRIPREPDE